MRTSQPPADLDLAEGTNELPLLELVEDLSRYRPVTVALHELPSSTGGGVLGSWPDFSAIVLDPALLVGPGELGRGFAHELAHLLDELFGEWSDDEAEREHFANTLGPLLLEHRPRRVAEAMQLGG